MNTLSNVMQKQSAVKTTENGAVAYSTTNNAILDFFSLAGSMRNRNPEDIIEKFELAYKESPELAIKALFYVGDIRGGLGERRTFRLCLRRLAHTNPEVVKRNIHLIPEYNRWDSIFELFDTEVEDIALDFILHQFIKDVTNKNEGKSIADLSLQVNYLFDELGSGSYAVTMEAITDETASAVEIATTFCLNFERPANKEVGCPNRANADAQTYLNYVENGCQ